MLDAQAMKEVFEFNSKLWFRTETHDARFIVGQTQKTFGAHRDILAQASDVFFAMFYGPQKERDPRNVIVGDVDPDAFEVILQYVYTRTADIGPAIAHALLYAAKKYMLQSLAELCVQWLDSNLNDDTVC